MRKLFFLLTAITFLNFHTLRSQCPEPIAFGVSEIENGDGNCTYDFLVKYAPGTSNSSMDITINCGTTTFVGPDDCSGQLSTSGGNLIYGSFITICCTSDPILSYNSYEDDPNCGGSSCDSGSILPISLSSFTVTHLTGNHFDVSWSTEQEINNSHFMVEHSEDGINFKSIKKVTGQGTTNSKVDYKVNVIASSRSGINYFRLYQEDHDKSGSYSKIISVMSDQLKKLELITNPVENYLRFDRRINSSYEIVNNAGSQIRCGILSDESEIDISELNTGFYIIRLESLSNNQSSVFKFIKR